MLKFRSLQTSADIAILWYGKEWQSSLMFLQKLWFENITILDRNQISCNDVISITGESYLDSLDRYDYIIKSPGISLHHEKIFPHRDRVWSQTQIFFEFYTWKVIGITGTKGKSTVSSLTYETLKAAWYKVRLVWNIGKPVLDEIDVLSEVEHDYLIYELSSYMLEDFKPKLYIWYINNIFPCHIDWHTSMDIYTQAKYNILQNAEHKITHESLQWWDVSFPNIDWYHYKNKDIFKKNNLLFQNITSRLIWEHNMVNLCWVLNILEIAVWDENKIIKSFPWALSWFKPLRHRLENLWIYKWIQFVDDGAAVTPEATIAAIKWLWSKVQTLLIWWKDHNYSISDLEEIILNSRIQNIVLFPDFWYKLFSSYVSHYKEDEEFKISLWWKDINVLKTKYMEQAVVFSYKHTQENSCVLLSSAAQSYSLWKSFEEKWEQYQKYIEKYAKI